jgi:zinc transport system substrate-binding protein
LKALDADLKKRLAPLKGTRFIVSHDSIQYFEKRYGLAAAGSISISPDRPPSARRLYDIRTRILRDRVVCVFGEPQVPDTLVKTAVEGTKARTGKIDTDGGIGVPEGKDAYFAIMRNIAGALAACLGPG